MDKNTLIVKHLPKAFTNELCFDFFKHFGACNARFMGCEGRMKNCAFVEFRTELDAKCALSRLHQLSFLNTTLVAEFSKSLSKWFEDPVFKNTISEKLNSGQEKNSLKKDKVKLNTQIYNEINSISPNLHFEYPINPNLCYSYPKPTLGIILNISNALASVPKFYVQVLHLMNKMNLPAPFSQPSHTAALVDQVELTSSDESEYDSSTENNSDNLRKRKKQIVLIDEATRKRIKLQLMVEAQLKTVSNQSANTAVQNLKDVFEEANGVEKSKRIDIKIPNDLEQLPNIESENPTGSLNLKPLFTVESNGFGKIVPETNKILEPPLKTEHEWKKEVFFTKEELAANKLAQSDYKNFAAFKNYKAGEPSCRLYLKNLDKHTSEKHLHRIFGRYVVWGKEENLYDIRLMREGRMKGQAFVSLPSERQATLALNEVNGYMLHGKPVAVHFARCAKLKTT